MQDFIPTHPLSILLPASAPVPDLLLREEYIQAAEAVIAAPYRSSYYGVGLCLRGTAQLRVNLTTYAVESGWLIALSPPLIKQWLARSPDFQSLAVFFTAELLPTELLPAGSGTRETLPGFDPTQAHVFGLPADQQQQLIDTLRLVQRKQALPTFSTALARDLLRLLLREVATCCTHQAQVGATNSTSRGQWLVTEFKRLVSQQCLRERSVTTYATQLCITPGHLNETVKLHTGRTAGELITEAVVLEAKVLLQDPTRSIAQLADHLHFPDQSAFGRYFRHATGLSPKAYRQAS